MAEPIDVTGQFCEHVDDALAEGMDALVYRSLSDSLARAHAFESEGKLTIAKLKAARKLLVRMESPSAFIHVHVPEWLLREVCAEQGIDYAPDKNGLQKIIDPCGVTYWCHVVERLTA